MEILFTPWRYRFVSRVEAAAGCFFCDAVREPDDPERLVVGGSRHFVVMLNRYPYTNGHLLIAPAEHVRAPEDSAPEARAEFWPVVLAARACLERAYGPDGMNLGMNLGRAAGAGAPEHYHFHLVPRWAGDTSFTSVVGSVRLVPEELLETRERLAGLLAEELSG